MRYNKQGRDIKDSQVRGSGVRTVYLTHFLKNNGNIYLEAFGLGIPKCIENLKKFGTR